MKTLLITPSHGNNGLFVGLSFNYDHLLLLYLFRPGMWPAKGFLGTTNGRTLTDSPQNLFDATSSIAAAVFVENFTKNKQCRGGGG